MKNYKQRCFIVIVFFWFIIANFTACDNGTNKTVDVKYQFTGDWRNVDLEIIEGAISTLGENTFTVSGGGVNISFTGVHTVHGGSFLPEQWGLENTWAYLYSGAVKIGVVVAPIDGNNQAYIGYTFISRSMDVFIWANDIDVGGMQDTHNGAAFEQ